jgi:hypothetical protein
MGRYGNISDGLMPQQQVDFGVYRELPFYDTIE